MYVQPCGCLFDLSDPLLFYLTKEALGATLSLPQEAKAVRDTQSDFHNMF